MSVEHFLADLEEGTLVIVPGDRADILVASLASTLTADVPTVAGIIITAGYEPDAAVLKLLQAAPFPVLKTPERTYAVATRVHGVKPQLRAGDERKIASALGAFGAGVDPLELEERMSLERPARMTPIMFEYDLVERAKQSKQHIVLPEGDDDRILRAADILLRRGVVDLTILGDPEDIRVRKAARSGSTSSGVTSRGPADVPSARSYAERYHELRKHKGVTEELAFDTVGDVTYFGTMMVDAGRRRRHGLGRRAHDRRHHPAGLRDHQGPARRVGGLERVPDVPARPGARLRRLRRQPEAGRRAARRHRDQLGRDRASFGVEPRIAMLSYSTGESGKGEDVDAVRAATGLVGERRPDLKVEGPIQYDAAVDAAVARRSCPAARWPARRPCSSSPTSTPATSPTRRCSARRRRRDRAGAAGPAQAGERSQPRLHRAPTSSTPSSSRRSRRHRIPELRERRVHRGLGQTKDRGRGRRLAVEAAVWAKIQLRRRARLCTSHRAGALEFIRRWAAMAQTAHSGDQGKC